MFVTVFCEKWKNFSVFFFSNLQIIQLKANLLKSEDSGVVEVARKTWTPHYFLNLKENKVLICKLHMKQCNERNVFYNFITLVETNAKKNKIHTVAEIKYQIPFNHILWLVMFT